MKTYGEFTDKESKVLKVLGCKNSLKNYVSRPIKVLGAIDSEEKKTTEKGEEYQTNFIKILDVETGEVVIAKFTQTVVLSQAVSVIENDLSDTEMRLEYAESSTGNNYLTLTY